MRKKLLSILTLAALLISHNADAQVTTNGGSGLAANYADLNAAITALNAATISTPVIITLTGNEMAPAGGYVITASGSAANTITIQGSGSTVTASNAHTAGSVFDGIFKIVGGDYITIQNFTLQENTANTIATVGTNTMTEFGIGLFYATTTDGAQNNIIQNNIITLGSYQNAIGIYSSTAHSATAVAAAAATANTGLNSGLKVYGNVINNVAFGIAVVTPPNTTTITESGIEIGGSTPATGNTINYGHNTTANGGWSLFSTASSGINVRNAINASIRYNKVSTISTLTVASTGVAINASTTPGITFTNTISNNHVTMTNSGTTAITGIDFGYGVTNSNIVGENDTVIINQNPSGASSAAITAIKANYSANKTINSNQITINQAQTTGALSSATVGITLAGTGATITADNNSLSFNQTTSSTSAVTASITGITATSAASAGLSLNNNTIKVNQATTGSGSYGSGAVTYFSINAAHAGINITGNNFHTSGGVIRSTGALDVILDGSSTKTGLINIKSNSVNIERISATGNVGFYTQTSTTPNDPADSISNNTITFTNLATTGTVTVINRLGGATTAAKNYCNNVINVSGTNTGSVVGIAVSYASVLNVGGNSITINCASTSISGITMANGASNGNITQNMLSLTSSSLSPTSMIGITTLTSTGPHQIHNNNFSALNLTGLFTTSPTVSGVVINSGNGNAIYNNAITNISVGASGVTSNATVDGILISGGTATNVYKNKIYAITTSAAGTATVLNGIRISGGTTNSVFNNLIGGLSTPAAASVDAIRGISITSAATNATNNIVYNTVYLNASSSGANFGTSGIFHTSNASATTGKLVMRNNIIINNSTPAGTGLTVAYRRSNSTLSNYDDSSNANLFYAGTPGASNLIFYDGTNSYQTFASYKAALVPRDQNSFTENTSFLSTTGSSSAFLHVNSSIPTLAEGGAIPVALITDDYDGDPRNATTPDVGADEFNGTTPAPVISNITINPSAPQCVTTARTVTATVSSAFSSITSVVINYNNGTAGSANMTLVSGTTTNGVWTGTIPTASPADTTVIWSITANDGTYVTMETGLSYRDAYLTDVVTTATASDSTVCGGVNTTLSVKAQESNPGLVNIGTQTTTISGNVGNPYRTSNTVGNQVRTQMLVRASELSAQGLVAGPITSIGFTTTAAAGTVVNFSINMAPVSATTLTTTYMTVPMTNVFNQASFSPALGLNTHVFSTPFIWDGISNVLIEVCQQQSVIGTTTIAAFAPGYASNVGNAVAGGCTAVSGTAAANRPIMRFGGIVGVDYTSSMTWTWNPSGTGTGASVTVAPTTTTAYTATGIDVNGCSLTSNPVTITVNPPPAAPVATNSVQCGSGLPAASVTSGAGANGNGTFLWYNAPTNGNLLQGAALGNTLAAYYTNDFNSSALTNASLSGQAAISGGSLILHPALTNQQGGLTVNASGVNSTMFQTTFDLSLTSTGTTMADGFSYSFADDALATTTNPSAEHGSGSKLRIGFFTYNPANAADGMGIYLMYGVNATTGYTASTPGVLAYSTDVSWVPTTATTLTSPVSVSITAAGQLTLVVGATTIFNNVQLPAAYLNANKSAWKHVFASRSGGTAGGFAMDNLLIQANTIVPGHTTYQTPLDTTTVFYVSEMGVNGCESARTPVTVTVNIPDTVFAAASSSVCQNASLQLNASKTGTTNSYSYNWTAMPATGSGISGSAIPGSSVSVTPTLPGTYVYTVSAKDTTLNCNTSASVTVTVTPQPVNLVASANPQAICSGDSINLTASSGISSSPSVIFNESFNATTNNWTTSNLTTGGTPAATAWGLQNSPFTTSSGWGEVLSSPGNSQFYVTSSDAGGSGNNTHTILQSPAINTTGLQSLSLHFFHYFKYWSNADSIKVEASTDSISWTLVQDLAQTTPAMIQNQAIGTPNNFAAANISLNSYVGNPTLYIRFRYRAVWGYGWAIDSVRLTGSLHDAITWSSIPAGYIASGASQSNIKPASNTTYIATATNSYGCIDTAHTMVVVNKPSIAASANATTVCANNTFNLEANVMDEKLDSATNNWTVINNSTGGTIANASWTLRTSPYVYAGITFNSNNASQFYMTNSDAQGSGGNTRTILQSPSFSTLGMTTLNLAFNHHFRAITGDSGVVEISTDGANWTILQAYTATVGAASAFTLSSINLNSYTGHPSVYVRFRYRANYGWYWAIDNIKISGNSTNTFAWTSTPSGFTSASQNPTGVTATDTTTYSVLVTDGNGCTASSSIVINVNPVISGNTISSAQTICSGSAPAQLTGGIVSGGSGTYSYLWLSTTDTTAGYSIATGANTGINYTPGVLTDTTWFRRIVLGGVCTDTSASVQIIVTPGITNNTISASQNICSGTAPAQLVGSSPAGAGGSYTYTWLSSTTSATSGFGTAAGLNTNINYTPAALSATTWYKRVVNTATCTDTSSAVGISVSSPVTGNTISASQTICAGAIPIPLTGSITGIYDDLNGMTSTAGLTTASLPSGWTMVQNQGNLLTGFNTNSYGRPSPNGAIRANNYSVSSGVAIMDTKNFGPSISGDSLRFDVAYGAYEDGFGPYSDTLRIYTTSGSGYTLLKQYITGLNVDTSENGVNTAPFSTGSFTPTASQWTRKKIAIPAGTINVRFEFASGWGNMMYLDRIQVDSAAFTWLSSTTSAATGFTIASGVANASGYTPGALTQTTWFKRVANNGGPCLPDTSAAVVITVNPSAAITSQPASNTNICATNTIALNVVATNATGYQWYKGTTPLANGGNISGATSANLRIVNAAIADAGTYSVIVTGAGSCDDTSNNSVVTVNSLGSTLAANGANQTYVHSDGITNLYTDASCNPILKIVDTAGGNTLNNVVASVNILTSVQNAPNGQKYLQRYYNVTPSSNGTALVTLYALQTELTAYNNAPGTYPLMPTSGNNSDPNIANIRVTKYTGSPFTGGGNALLIMPTSVIWNSVMSWWEITFPVSSFSSFYIHTGNAGPLNVDIIRITARNLGDRNRVDWATGSEVNADRFEVERSADGKHFSYIGAVMANGEAATYSFTDQHPFDGQNHYRLKMIDRSGAFEYSKTVTAFVKTNGTFAVEAFPNPVNDRLAVRVNGEIGANAYIILTDMAGKLIIQQKVSEIETIIDMSQVAQGVYFMKYIDDKHSQTIKVKRN